jgi:hypothetical protein
MIHRQDNLPPTTVKLSAFETTVNDVEMAVGRDYSFLNHTALVFTPIFLHEFIIGQVGHLGALVVQIFRPKEIKFT